MKHYEKYTHASVNTIKDTEHIVTFYSEKYENIIPYKCTYNITRTALHKLLYRLNYGNHFDDCSRDLYKSFAHISSKTVFQQLYSLKNYLLVEARRKTKIRKKSTTKHPSEKEISKIYEFINVIEKLEEKNK